MPKARKSNISSLARGGFNTFTPMLVAIHPDKDPAKRIKMVDVDCNGRACPELNTTLTAYWNLILPSPMGLGSLHGDEVAVYPVSDHSGEQIARALCMYMTCVSVSPHGA